MKIALILPGSIWFAPYVRNYTRILDKENVNYDIISWNREGDDKPEGFQYNVVCKNGHNSAGFSAYSKYIKFIKSTIKREKFDKIIVFGPQMACLLSTYLLTHFRGRYMIDYRDLSIEQRLGFKQIFSIMLKFSYANVISSPGFMRCLPKRKYYLSHNFNEEFVVKAISQVDDSTDFYKRNSIDVLTIGAIRDFSSNIQIIKALADQDGFTVRFVGKIDLAPELQTYCEDNHIKNISFKGYYPKEEEPEYINTCTFMNIFYPRVITHDTALSNRFYNSLIYKKPMIVTKHTCQGDYAEKYQVGISVENCDDLKNDLNKFLHMDYISYCKRCNNLLSEFLNDQYEFVNIIKEFIK